MSKENHIRFVSKEKSLFFPTLRKRVEAYFEENKISRHANSVMIIKTMVILVAYLGSFVIILFNPENTWLNMVLWGFMGFALAGTGMSIMHDANHGSYSSSQKVNNWLGHTLNLAGGSVFNWKLQHNILHHTYTNVPNMDEDIDDKLIMRFSPENKVRWYHRFQFIYVFLFYSILTLYWVLLKDFSQFTRYIKKGVNHNKPGDNLSTLIKIIGVKLGYFFVVFFVPIYFFGHRFGLILIGFLIMHAVAGSVLSLIFQLAHTVEGTVYPKPNNDGVIENDWAIHQMQTTVNFSPTNKIISWYIGGLNYQVEHHLFPRICHVHYPQISKIVQQTAKEFGVPYLCNETFAGAVSSHLKTLKKFGMPRLDEIMA